MCVRVLLRVYHSTVRTVHVCGYQTTTRRTNYRANVDGAGLVGEARARIRDLAVADARNAEAAEGAVVRLLQRAEARRQTRRVEGQSFVVELQQNEHSTGSISCALRKTFCPRQARRRNRGALECKIQRRSPRCRCRWWWNDEALPRTRNLRQGRAPIQSRLRWKRPH